MFILYVDIIILIIMYYKICFNLEKVFIYLKMVFIKVSDIENIYKIYVKMLIL